MSTKSILRVIRAFMIGGIGSRIILSIRFANCLSHENIFRRILHLRMQRYGIYISEKSIIGVGLKLPHPVGIVIGEGVVIGKNVKIYQNVTLGGARIGDAKNKNYPIVGDNVVIFAGAVLIGKINIGNNAIIGANAVVINDVPDGATCVGVPGKIVRHRINGS